MEKSWYLIRELRFFLPKTSPHIWLNTTCNSLGVPRGSKSESKRHFSQICGLENAIEKSSKKDFLCGCILSQLPIYQISQLYISLFFCPLLKTDVFSWVKIRLSLVETAWLRWLSTNISTSTLILITNYSINFEIKSILVFLTRSRQ